MTNATASINVTLPKNYGRDVLVRLPRTAGIHWVEYPMRRPAVRVHLLVNLAALDWLIVDAKRCAALKIEHRLRSSACYAICHLEAVKMKQSL